jgi:hypothetical protein
MKLSKTFKMIIGALTLLQIVGSIGFIYKIFRTFSNMAMSGDIDEAEAMSSMVGVMGGASLLSILGLGLLIFYIIHAAKNQSIEGGIKAMWIILFVLAGFFTMPIYFFMQIWNEKEAPYVDGEYGDTV